MEGGGEGGGGDADGVEGGGWEVEGDEKEEVGGEVFEFQHRGEGWRAC